MEVLWFVALCGLFILTAGLPRGKKSSFQLHQLIGDGNIDVEVTISRDEPEEENVCTMKYTNMTAWERSNIITFYGFMSAFSGQMSSLSWIPCSQEKCHPGFNYRLFRAVTYASSPHCCHGYKAANDGSGCPVAIKKKPILDALNDLEATAFLRIVNDSDSDSLTTTLSSGKSRLTVFYLDNDDMSKTEISTNILDSPRRFIKSHIVRGLRYTDTFNDEEVLSSLSGGSIRVRFILDGGIPTILANCVPLSDVTDHVALNGVLHKLEKPLPIPKLDLLEWLATRDDLSIFYAALSQSSILDPSKLTSFTLFVPTNDAFSELSQKQWREISTSQGRLAALLKQHASDLSICDVMLDNTSSPCTLVGNRLIVNRTSNGLFVNNASVLESDIITTNGVIHVINTTFIPEQALLIPEVFPVSSLTTFVIEEANVAHILSEHRNLTFLVPDTDALQGLLENIQANNKSWLHELLSEHIIYAPFMAHDFVRPGGTPFPYFDLPNADDDEHMTKLRGAIRLLKLQCGHVVRRDVEAFNGNIHEIDRVLIEPSENAWTVLKSDPRFSIFVKIASMVGLDSILQTEEVTVFAPKNQQFQELSAEDFNKLLVDRTHAEETIRYHIATVRMCKHDVKSLGFPPPWYRYSTGQVETFLQGKNLRIRSNSETTFVNNIGIVEPDIVSSNGVIHIINGVLFSPQPPPRFISIG